MDDQNKQDTQNKRITIKSIADELGVSEGTVDRAIHNRQRISDDMRERVLEKVIETGYHPNALASTLGRNKTVRISALLPDYAEFWVQMREGVCDAAAEWADFNVEISLSDNYQENSITDQLRIVDELEQDAPDGVIVVPFSAHIFRKPIGRLASKGISIVTVNRDCPESERICYVGENAYGMGFTVGTAYTRLLAAGDMVGVLSVNTHEEQINLRTRGFIDAVKSNDSGITLFKKRHEPTKKSVYEQITAIIKEHTDIKSLFFNTSEGAYWAAAAKRELGLSFSLAGIDVTEEYLKMLDERLMDFTVSQSPYLQGHIAVSILLNHLIRGITPRDKQFFTSTDIILDRSHYKINREGIYKNN